MFKLRVSSITAALVQADKKTRMEVADGKVQVEPQEIIPVLFFLSNDRNMEVRKTAQKNFAGLPENSINNLLLSPDTEPEMLDFINRLFPKNISKIALILKNSSTDKKTLDRIIDKADEKIINLIYNNLSLISNHPDLMKKIVNHQLNATPLTDSSISDENSFQPDYDKKEEEAEEEEASIYKKILGMGISDRIKFAITGNKEARGILVKDPNKLVCGNVMKNHRVTESEIVMISSSRNVSTEVLRMIAKNKDWIKKYQVQFNLVTNPRVPVSISLNLLKYIRKKDLGLISKSSNVPKAVANMAKRILVKKGKN